MAVEVPGYAVRCGYAASYHRRLADSRLPRQDAAPLSRSLCDDLKTDEAWRTVIVVSWAIDRCSNGEPLPDGLLDRQKHQG